MKCLEAKFHQRTVQTDQNSKVSGMKYRPNTEGLNRLSGAHTQLLLPQKRQPWEYGDSRNLRYMYTPFPGQGITVWAGKGRNRISRASTFVKAHHPETTRHTTEVKGSEVSRAS